MKALPPHAVSLRPVLTTVCDRKGRLRLHTLPVCTPFQATQAYSNNLKQHATRHNVNIRHDPRQSAAIDKLPAQASHPAAAPG